MIRATLIAIGMCGLASASPASQAAPQSTAPAAVGHQVTLTAARVSTLADGRIVISMNAAGDLRGLMTLTLDPNGAGSYTGRWALVVGFLQDLNPDGTVATAPPEIHEDPTQHAQHREYARIVRRGTLTGDVSQATLRVADDGRLAGVQFAQLTVASGSMTFAGASGYGTMAAFYNAGAFAGSSLTLTF